MKLYSSTSELKVIIEAIKSELYKSTSGNMSRQEFDVIFDKRCGTKPIVDIINKINDSLLPKSN